MHRFPRLTTGDVVTPTIRWDQCSPFPRAPYDVASPFRGGKHDKLFADSPRPFMTFHPAPTTKRLNSPVTLQLRQTTQQLIAYN